MSLTIHSPHCPYYALCCERHILSMRKWLNMIWAEVLQKFLISLHRSPLQKTESLFSVLINIWGLSYENLLTKSDGGKNIIPTSQVLCYSNRCWLQHAQQRAASHHPPPARTTPSARCEPLQPVPLPVLAVFRKVRERHGRAVEQQRCAWQLPGATLTLLHMLSAHTSTQPMTPFRQLQPLPAHGKLRGRQLLWQLERLARLRTDEILGLQCVFMGLYHGEERGSSSKRKQS